MTGKRVYPIDDKCFDKIDTEEKAYLLGFIFADGSVSKNGYYLSLDILKSDEYIIDALLNLVYKGGTCPGKYYHGCDMVNSEYVRVTISSKELVSCLSCYGVIPNKVWTLRFPYWMDDTLVCHFIRGYFDGNGTITDHCGRPFFSIVSNYDFVMSILNILHDKCNVRKVRICRSSKKSDIMKFTISRYSDLGEIYHYLYDGSHVHLIRKYDKFTLLVNGIRECPAFKKKSRSSVHKGVSFDRSRGKWIAHVKKKYVGRYDSEDEAYRARLDYETKTCIGSESGCNRSN